MGCVGHSYGMRRIEMRHSYGMRRIGMRHSYGMRRIGMRHSYGMRRPRNAYECVSASVKAASVERHP